MGRSSLSRAEDFRPLLQFILTEESAADTRREVKIIACLEAVLLNPKSAVEVRRTAEGH